MLSKRPDSQRGATVLLFTFCTLMLVIPLVGLAIDGSVALWTKAKLAAAVDAAALAAGRSMNVSGDFQQQEENAEDVAQKWFTANFPTQWMNTTLVSGPTPSCQSCGVSVSETPAGCGGGTCKTITANVSASVQAPLFFLRILGSNFQNVTIGATATSSRRNLVLILVLDRSGSMSEGTRQYPQGACPIMVADAQNFVNYFTNGFDTLGLVTFSSSANPNLDYPPSLNFKTSSPSLSSVIGEIQCTGATSTTQALNIAYNAIQQVDEQSALNVIVLFTDGQPNTILATNWPIKSGSSCTDPDGSGLITDNTTVPGAITTDTSNEPDGIYDPRDYTAMNSGGSLSPIASTYNAAGCRFEGSHWGGGNLTDVDQDISSIPSQDSFGNSTSGYYTRGSSLSGDNLTDAAFNTADNQAYTIRHDTKFQPIIFTIGLGSGVGDTEKLFLERLANDPRSGTGYDPTLAAGTFVYAPDASQLQVAFYQIASEILRLSQ